jgi:hypothetical protein
MRQTDISLVSDILKNTGWLSLMLSRHLERARINSILDNVPDLQP